MKDRRCVDQLESLTANENAQLHDQNARLFSKSHKKIHRLHSLYIKGSQCAISADKAC